MLDPRAEALLGRADRLISRSKSGYKRRHPDHVVMFNANVCLRARKLWHWDLDLTLDEASLSALAAELCETVYVLTERDARVANGAGPPLERARYSVTADGHTRFPYRWIERSPDGVLRRRPRRIPKPDASPYSSKSVIVQNAGQFTDVEPLIDEEAGTITFVTTFKGLPEKIQTANGPVLLRDAGLITFMDTFDLETGEFISSDIIIKGPHPEAESDFTLFCEVITEALT